MFFLYQFFYNCSFIKAFISSNKIRQTALPKPLKMFDPAPAQKPITPYDLYTFLKHSMGPEYSNTYLFACIIIFLLIVSPGYERS